MKRILREHGIEMRLASEGGRTSRGSVGLAREYCEFLNGLASRGILGKTDTDQRECLREIEDWWIQRVLEFFAQQRLEVDADVADAVSTIIGSLLSNAEDRQKMVPGITTKGAVLQHLVGAKLETVIGEGKIAHRPYSTADRSTGEQGDFVVGDIAVHVTAMPTEGLLERCRRNLRANVRPVVVVPERMVPAAEALLANDPDVAGRVEVIGAEKLISVNIYEKAGFRIDRVRDQVEKLFRTYNQIVARVETDKSLLIEGYE